VWAGTIVMGIGFILAFFVYHRRVWIIVRETGRSSEVKLGGMINKNNFAFEKDMADLTELIKGE
ncbi:MAG: cytochrome c biogenesis protein ResB, partial [Deltaproteobacteria bacterium]|nr:cytochrome c biogenesis protein ResB [Deltaproteobacteria bacterium]